MCNKSETIGKIAAALVAFAGEVKSISHDANNPHFKSQYTSLDHMIDETKPILQKHGLTIMQFPGGDGEKITMRTMILHSSGEWIESEPLTLRPTKIDPQGAGSAITYARRYSYAAALSLSLGDDDDGNAASQKPTQTYVHTPKTNVETPSKPSNESQIPSTIKAKFQLWKGSIDGLDAWYHKQREKYADKQIESFITSQIKPPKVVAVEDPEVDLPF